MKWLLIFCLWMASAGADELTAFLEELEDPAATSSPVEFSESTHVAVLLPMSGAYKPLGHRLLSSLKLALFQGGFRGITLDVYDTQGSAEGAKKAFQQLVGRRPALILGPLRGVEVAALKPLVEEAQIPLLTFSNDETGAGRWSFVFGITPRQQAKMVAGILAKQKSAGILVVLKNSPYGHAMLREIKDAIRDNPLTVLWVEEDQKGALTEDQMEEVQGKSWSFVWAPGWEREVVTLGSHLRQRFPKRVFRFLGTDDWYHRDYLQDPALVGSWFLAPSTAPREAFLKSYQEAFHASPSPLELLAYDAGKLTFALLQSVSGGAFREALVSSPGFKTLAGACFFAPSGLLERSQEVLEIRDQGKVRPLPYERLLP